MSAPGSDGGGIPVVLRPIELRDADRIHEWASQERACRYQAWGPNTRAETESFVVTAVGAWERPEGERRVWVAVSPELGVVGMGGLKRHSATSEEVGYSVHVDHWGRGVGTEIARLLVGLAFADPSVERVEATCDPRNLASASVLLRVGFVFEGTLRHTLQVRDGWRDSAMHSILRREWIDRDEVP